jgi:co-chaperonin GroES (HSP10)
MIRGVGAPSVEATKNKVEEARAAHTLPVPQGWKILIAMPVLEEKTSGGGIILPSQTKNAEEVAANIGYVVSMGPDCYTDMSRYASGPWCKLGDWIIMRSYSGSRFTIGGHEFRLINEDTVEAVIEDPSGFTRA